jgi:hypothetical protein
MFNSGQSRIYSLIELLVLKLCSASVNLHFEYQLAAGPSVPYYSDTSRQNCFSIPFPLVMNFTKWLM